MKTGEALHSAFGTILVVDDDPLLRLLAVDLLTDAGLVTCEASNAEAAIARLNTVPDISLLLTDVKMPGSMNGLQLVSLVHKFRPDIKFIVASDEIGQCAIGLPGGSRFVGKPYNAVSLISDVYSLLRPEGPAVASPSRAPMSGLAQTSASKMN